MLNKEFSNDEAITRQGTKLTDLLNFNKMIENLKNFGRVSPAKLTYEPKNKCVQCAKRLI